MRRRLHDLYRSSRGAPAHPDSPAGGTGIGHARPPRSTSLGDDHFGWGSLPHPDSPAGRHVTQADIARADTERFIERYALAPQVKKAPAKSKK